MLDLRIDMEKCTQCGECVRDCPAGVLALGADGPHVMDGREGQCIRCQHCLAVCAPGALSIFGKDPAQSLPLKGRLPSAEQMEVLIKGRRSTRHFRREPVSPDIVERLMDGIASAPTGVNSRALQFTLVEDPDVMDAVRRDVMDGLQRKVEDGSLPEAFSFFRGLCSAWQRGRDIVFRGAPHMLIVSAPDGSPCPEADPFIALSYFELYAASFGVGTVWCGYAKYALFDVLPECARRLGIPADHNNAYVMMFGMPAVKYYRTVQRDQQGLVRATWE